MRKNYNAWPAPLILLIILCAACDAFVLGQGGTGRETPKANANKTPPATKRKRPSRKAASKTPSTAPANTTAPSSSGTPTKDERKADDAAANERTYWATIRLSTDPKDFKTYLEKYPNGTFSGLARDNLTRLETAPKTPLKTDSAGRIILGSISGSDTEATKPPPKPGSIVRNQIGMELVYVPAGSFMMGSNNGEPIEKPLHEVTIKEGFYMGRYEVTQAEWQQVMGNNPSQLKSDRLPVALVSWDDAQSFISKLNERGDGFKYRLPSEAEWEYACRAGTTGDYAGDVKEMGWFTDNSGGRTHVGGEKRPNAFGLYDMHGNVFEWCSDSYHGSYAGAPVDGSAWLSGKWQDHRMFRGGSYGNRAALLRSAARVGHRQSGSSSSIGFRVAALMLTR